jgi:hypothetical protein
MFYQTFFLKRFQIHQRIYSIRTTTTTTGSLFVWLVAGGLCWFVLREKYCWLIVGGWFVVREKYCWLVADKPSEQGAELPQSLLCQTHHTISQN